MGTGFYTSSISSAFSGQFLIKKYTSEVIIYFIIYKTYFQNLMLRQFFQSILGKLKKLFKKIDFSSQFHRRHFITVPSKTVHDPRYRSVKNLVEMVDELHE